MSGLPDGWGNTKLGKVIETNKSSIDRNYQHSEIYYLDTGSITQGTIESLQPISLNEAPSRAKRLVRDKSIVYSTVRPIQRHYGIIDNPVVNLVVSTGFTVIESVESKSSAKFIYYFLTADKIVQKLDMIANGSVSTYPSIKPSDIENLSINLPSLPEQKTIANILSSFDEKIELLREQNETLETLAQTIFKEWFVHFNYPDATGEMVDSEFGEIPKGWRVGRLEEIIEFTNGYAFKSKELIKSPTNNSYSIFKMGHIKKGGGFNSAKTKDYIEKERCNKLAKYVLKKGDILMCMTDMKDSTSLLGHTALMFDDDSFIVNQRVGLIRAHNKIHIDYPWLYLLTNNINFISDLRKRANSGVQVNLSTFEIKDSPVLIPNERTNKIFDETCKSIFEKIQNNTNQIQTLTKTRDTLLPKLMCGEVRVS